MLNIVSLLVSAAIVLWLTTRVIIIYSTTAGTRSERIFATAKQSATQLWLGICGLVTQGGNLLTELLAQLGVSPEVRTAIETNFPTKTASIVVAAVIIGGMLARNRTLPKA